MFAASLCSTLPSLHADALATHNKSYCFAQAALLAAFGPELVPTFLGGQLDYDAVRQQWLDKMDAAIAQRQQHPRGKQVGWGCDRGQSIPAGTLVSDAACGPSAQVCGDSNVGAVQQLHLSATLAVGDVLSNALAACASQHLKHAPL
jgi:hypothetical protein